MDLINLTSQTTKPIIEQLTNKYAFLKKNKSELRDLIYSSLNYTLDSLNDLTVLANSVSTNILAGGTDNLTILLHNGIINNNRSCHKFRIYHAHALSDFKVIRFAVYFYGKLIDDLAHDVLCLCNFDHSVFKQINNNDSLRDMFLHLVRCELMMALGILFYNLQIAMMLEIFNIGWVGSVCQTIVEYIETHDSYDYTKLIKDKTLRKILPKMESELKCKKGIYHKNFYRDNFKIIYDMYQPLTELKQLTTKQLREYVNNNLDMKALIGDKANDYLRTLLLTRYYYLVPISVLVLKPSEPSADAKPNLLPIPNAQLCIEV